MPQLFTSATEDALKQFQRNHGLAVTGMVDGATLFALNVPAERRLATIRANIPRLAEYSKDLGSRYIVVNIPAQQIETVNDGKVYSLHNAIVGRPSRPDARGDDAAHHRALQSLLERAALDRREGHPPAHDLQAAPPRSCAR